MILEVKKNELSNNVQFEYKKKNKYFTVFFVVKIMSLKYCKWHLIIYNEIEQKDISRSPVWLYFR